MSKEFLERLFWACSDEVQHHEAGENLSELYEKSDEIEHGWTCFDKALKSLGLEPKGNDQVGNIVCTLTDEYEKQGFINGFKLGMKLAGELEEGVEA